MQEIVLLSRLSDIPWFPCPERDQRELTEHRVRVLYKESCNPMLKPLGNLQNSCILHL